RRLGWNRPRLPLGNRRGARRRLENRQSTIENLKRRSSSCQSQARRPTIHVWGGEPVRYVRLQAGADSAARAEIRSGREGGAVSERAGRMHEKPMAMEAAWQMWPLGQQSSAESR